MGGFERRRIHARAQVGAAWGIGVALTLLLAQRSLAVDGPYQVDDSEINEPGTCTLDASASRGDSRAWIAALAPSCTFSALRRIEFDLSYQRTRFDAGYATTVGMRAKGLIVPLPIRGFAAGVALAAGLDYSASDHRLGAIAVTMPVTLRPFQPLHINLNVGWQRDALERRDLFTYGAGFELGADWPVAVIGEVFGSNRGRGAAQVGVRPRLIEGRLYLNVIYGRNLDGMRSNWVTAGTTLYF